MRLVEVEADAWDQRLDALGVSDVYWRRGYLEASAPLEGGEPVLLELASAAGSVVFAAVLRPDPLDAVTPYGYGGPLGVGEDPPLELFAAAYGEWCAGRGVLSTFALEHPAVIRQAAGRTAAGWDRSELAGTVLWPLREPSGTPIAEPDLLAGMHAHHRRLVRRAYRAGLTASVHADAPSLTEFAAIYAATMRRRAAAAFYYFGAAYWDALRAGVALVRIDVRDADGTLVAGVLGMGTQGPARPAEPLLHYHLGATSDAGRGTGAAQLALLELARFGAARGYAGLHLGGGVGGRDDELLRYKRRFAPDGLIPSALVKAIHDQDAYRARTGRDDTDGFFPAYRDRSASRLRSATPSSRPRS